MKQAPVAALCGVSVAQVSRWERSQDLPSAAALLKLSELAPESERQWWRDRASEQAGINLQDTDSPGSYMASNLLRNIPLIKSHRGVGEVSKVVSADVESYIHFPEQWFPEGGAIRAFHIIGETVSKMIAMVDLSRRDADRLLGHMVAVQTPSGVEVRWLSGQDGGYILLPFQPGQPPKLLRPHGENSIVGLVRWIGDELDMPKQKGKPQ